MDFKLGLVKSIFVTLDVLLDDEYLLRESPVSLLLKE